MDPNVLWNPDGTPRLPDAVRNADGTPFADLAADELIEAAESTDMLPNVFLSRMRREARANVPAAVGDVVHLTRSETATHVCYAAIVTGTGLLEGDPDQLTVFMPGEAPEAYLDVYHDEGKTDRGWHWPESQ